jgi:glycosyltransferase involved in cell wall biosynthesis
MNIAFIGSRGIPRCYSGFETFVEELSVRLARRGHACTVYNRIPFNPYRKKTFRGVRIVRMPTIPSKGTDTIVHSLLCSLHGMTQGHDITYICGVGSALLSFLPRTAGSKTVVNVDGADFARAKWSGFGRWWLKQSESWASSLADAVIADHPAIRDRYRALYGRDTRLIPYGANVVETDPGTAKLDRWGLQPNRYFLYVSRLTPENAADLTLEAYLQSGQSIPLVVVGDAPYQNAYKARLQELASQSPCIHLTGYQFGETYSQLSFHARAFIYPTAIDATRPVVLDQMGFGNCVIARNTPANLEVLGDCAVPFDSSDPVPALAAALDTIAGDAGRATALGAKARQRVRERYDWETITTRYEELFEELLSGRPALA